MNIEGWDGTQWVKILVNAAGKLIIDPSEILEDTPTDGEVAKAPTSNWAFDHKALPNVHHVAFVAADHTAIGNGAPHHAEAHTLASHSTKAHAELTGVGAEDHGGPGEGHITIVGTSYSAIGAGTWAAVVDTTQVLNLGFYNSSNANLDNVSYQVYLAKGTYTLRFITVTGTNRAIVDIDIDGVEVASFDCYSSPGVFNVLNSQTGIVIATSGLKTIKFRVDGRNGSATAWYAQLSVMALWRTA